jgi:hypothetical protein
MVNLKRVFDEFFVELWREITYKRDGDANHRESFQWRKCSEKAHWAVILFNY